MANTAPIDTQTEVQRINLATTLNLEQRIKQNCDNMGSAGYQLCASFVQNGELILIFQLTR
jgi:hypothetical protein